MKKNLTLLRFIFRFILLTIIFLLFTNCSTKQETVKQVIDDVVTRFYSSMTESELSELNNEKILKLLTPDELKILSTKHWMFDVNVPVIVSVMQDQHQIIAPYWLEDAKFKKTKMVVKNEMSNYNVWQKSFAAGTINLGINGFDKHRPHYFVSILPQKPGDNLELINFHPKNQYVSVMDSGSFTYHDWDELVLSEIPEDLKGSKLLTTIRGRAREAHLINAFRKTKYPSSIHPDQIMLTWSKDPHTTQSIQWRTNPENNNGVVRYWSKGSDKNKEFSEVVAEKIIIEDRLLQNDRYINRYTAIIENLIPANTYEYIVGNPELNLWSEQAEFKTASKSPAPFSFTYFGDTHKSPHWGKLINDTYIRFPNTAFYSIGGDIVSTGLNRDEWDQLFEYSKEVIQNRPLMSTLGNHDSQDGLGYSMYTDLFDLPKNGSSKIPLEGSYSFEYNNAKFIMLDATSSKGDQAIWLEEQLLNCKSMWKFAMFHFPPYSYEEDYPVIREEWGALFDKYHVDIVFSGHVHYYMRSKPMFKQRPVSTPAEGTIYVISIAVPNRDKEMPEKEFVQVRFGGDFLYQNINIEGNTLDYRVFNQDGVEKDRLTIVK